LAKIAYIPIYPEGLALSRQAWRRVSGRGGPGAEQAGWRLAGGLANRAGGLANRAGGLANRAGGLANRADGVRQRFVLK